MSVLPPITPEGPKRTGPGVAVVHSPPKALEALHPTAGSEKGQVRLMPDLQGFCPSSARTQGGPRQVFRFRWGQLVGYLFIKFYVPTCNNSGSNR